MASKMLVLSLLCVTVTSKALANEAQCLANIMYAESRGENFEGVIAVAQAAVNRAKALDKKLCFLPGVHSKKPSALLNDYYVMIAKQALKPAKQHDIVKGADSWNTGKKPRQPGSITRVIGEHVFYIARSRQ